jgi:hypothetical protein
MRAADEAVLNNVHKNPKNPPCLIVHLFCRYKSLQRRNIIETRVQQKALKRLKRKRVEKRSYKMGWEETQLKKKKKRTKQ